MTDMKQKPNLHPLTPDELLARDNEPARESVPAEVARRLSTRRVVISHPKGVEAPERHGSNADPEMQIWQLAKGAILGMPGRSATLNPAPTARKATGAAGARLDPTDPHRPRWAEHVYHPKRTLAPAWQSRPAIRNGRRGEIFYGVYPPDDRAVYYPRGYPWQCVGRVFVWNDATAANWAWSGSAVLVGPRHVLTAGHVVPWDASSWMMQFVPGYYDGDSVLGAGATSWVSDAQGWDVSYRSRLPSAYDLAVLRLYDPVGDWIGWFGTRTYSSGGPIQYYNVTGYPSMVAGANRPSYQPGITVLDTDADGSALEIEHHGDTTGGDSGAPFWATWSDGFPYAVGVVSGGMAHNEPKDGGAYEDNNVVAGGNAMVDLVRWGLSTWT